MKTIQQTVLFLFLLLLYQVSVLFLFQEVLVGDVEAGCVFQMLNSFYLLTGFSMFLFPLGNLNAEC
jgi:hypothetical protein